MIHGHNEANMDPQLRELADAPEWSDADVERLFPNG